MPESPAIKWDFACLVEQVRSVCEITPDGCWLWRYGEFAIRKPVDERPYPRLMIAGKRQHVARWVLEASGQPAPQGMEPCHSCDRPPCCCPDHLHWDTHQANMAEMGARRRAGAQLHPDHVPRGEGHWMRREPERIQRGYTRTGNYAHGDDHWVRRAPELITWRGTDHHMARLDEDKVREIRARGGAGEKVTAIARSLGVERGTVRAVLEGRTWRHVT